MKRLATLLFAGALVALILTCVAPAVNAPISNDGPRADGIPAPPLPPWPDGGILLADGAPAPPLPPWPDAQGGSHA